MYYLCIVGAFLVHFGCIFCTFWCIFGTLLVHFWCTFAFCSKFGLLGFLILGCLGSQGNWQKSDQLVNTQTTCTETCLGPSMGSNNLTTSKTWFFFEITLWKSGQTYANHDVCVFSREDHEANRSVNGKLYMECAFDQNQAWPRFSAYIHVCHDCRLAT